MRLSTTQRQRLPAASTMTERTSGAPAIAACANRPLALAFFAVLAIGGTSSRFLINEARCRWVRHPCGNGFLRNAWLAEQKPKLLAEKEKTRSSSENC